MKDPNQIPESILKEIELNKAISKAALDSRRAFEDFTKANHITFADIEAEIKKLPQSLQNEIIHQANEIAKVVFQESDPHGQEQKQKLNRKLTRYKNKI